MRWVTKNWRDLALVFLMGVIALTWWDEMRAAFLHGYAARCVTPW